MRESGPLSLRQQLRFVPRAVEALIEIVAAKRPEVIVRRTRYEGLVVDEGVLTRAFPWVPNAPTLQVFVVLAGEVRLSARDGTSTEVLAPGDVALLSPSDGSYARYDDAAYLDVEWTPAEATPEPAPLRRLAPVDLSRATGVGERLAHGDAPDAEIFAEAFDLVRSAGAPLGDLSVAGMSGGPSPQDLKIARAITAQIADLRAAASASSLGELAELSPRQLQRILAQFCARYRMNATSWRDMRNRYRLQIALALMSIDDLPVMTIADEVGYASAPALARAFANAGLPPPSVIREELARGTDGDP